MTDKLRELTLLALESHGCERLKDFYECGPVQRAAVETFLEAALEQQDAQAVPVTWANAERIADTPSVDEAIRALLDDQTGDNATALVQAVLNAAPTPPAQRVMLTPDEIHALWFEHAPIAPAVIDFAQVIIEAYERKNGKEAP